MNPTIEFSGKVRRETIYGVVEDYGNPRQKMTLIPVKSELVIEWIVGEDTAPIDVIEIGITTHDKKVTGYDGVFELPQEAIKFLKDNGYDTSEVE